MVRSIDGFSPVIPLAAASVATGARLGITNVGEAGYFSQQGDGVTFAFFSAKVMTAPRPVAT